MKSRISRASVFTWSTFAGVLIATRGSASLSLLVLAPLVTFCISFGAYLLNDLFDFEVDKINAPERPIASQSVSRRQALLLVLMLDGAGAGIALLLGLLAFAVALVGVLFGICYSMRPLNFKDRFIIKTLSIGAGGAIANVFGGIVVGYLNWSLVFCSAMFLVFLFATSPINDLADYEGDLEQHRRTIPIVIGKARTLELSITASVIPLISAVIFSQFLGLNLISIGILSLLAARSLQLLLPLRRPWADSRIVRKHHKQMVLLHFVLQGAIAIGTVPL